MRALALTNCYCELTAQVIIRYRGFVQSERDILDSMGTWNVGHCDNHCSVMIRINLTMMLAQAVLLVISVTNVDTKAMMKLTSRGSRL